MDVFSGSTVERSMAPHHAPLYIALPSRAFSRLDLRQQLGIDDFFVAALIRTLVSTTLTTYLYLSPLCLTLAAHSGFLLRFTMTAAFSMFAQSLSAIWNSRAVRQARKKIVFEFAATILGPGGNMFILLLFWPGWILLGLSIWAMRMWFG